VILAPGLATTAAAQEYKQTNTGAEVYRTYCASCHGTAARGRWSARKRDEEEACEPHGRSPSGTAGRSRAEMVFKTIDGQQPVRGHGGPDMPVWGDVFMRSRDAGDAERVKAVIQSLVEFLDSIQLRPAHEQQ
jgi:mono/diheme cytochrome c family protein